jgi:hypothetical protein
MTDMYVYHFVGPEGSDGKDAHTTRAATLEAIKGRGEPLMETQLVVDHSELDADGFLNAIDNLWSEIGSLRLRAESRDTEALKLNETTEGQRKYMLQLESRELRGQARRLTAQRIELLGERFQRDAKTTDLEPFEGCPGYQV